LRHSVPDNAYVAPRGLRADQDDDQDALAINNFPAFSVRLKSLRYPANLKPAIDKYDGCSDPNIWLKTYTIAAQAAGGTFDHMAAYFPLAMAEMPLLWLDNLPAGCITSWASLSQLFTSNYQATYS
jgi:hypothetical protein